MKSPICDVGASSFQGMALQWRNSPLIQVCASRGEKQLWKERKVIMDSAKLTCLRKGGLFAEDQWEGS